MFFSRPKVPYFYDFIKDFLSRNKKARIYRIIVIVDHKLKDRVTFDDIRHDMNLLGLTNAKLVYKIKQISGTNFRCIVRYN
jgi:hypothetical protein